MSDNNEVADAQLAWIEFLKAMNVAIQAEVFDEVKLDLDPENENEAIIFARILMDQLSLSGLGMPQKTFLLRVGNEMGPDFAERLVSTAHFIKRTV